MNAVVMYSCRLILVRYQVLVVLVVISDSAVIQHFASQQRETRNRFASVSGLALPGLVELTIQLHELQQSRYAFHFDIIGGKSEQSRDRLLYRVLIPGISVVNFQNCRKLQQFEI